MKTFYFIISLALLVLGVSLNQELTSMGSALHFAVAALGFAVAGIASAVHDFNQKHNYK